MCQNREIAKGHLGANTVKKINLKLEFLIRFLLIPFASTRSNGSIGFAVAITPNALFLYTRIRYFIEHTSLARIPFDTITTTTCYRYAPNWHMGDNAIRRVVIPDSWWLLQGDPCGYYARSVWFISRVAQRKLFFHYQLINIVTSLTRFVLHS